MLLQLFIKNIALIDQIELSFGKGLHVMTGETGAGKSIVVDANGQVLARAGDAEELLYADVDMAASRRIRESRPYTGLRRTEFYI